MANRDFQQYNGAMVKRAVSLYAVVNVGSAGAVTFQKWNYASVGGATKQTYSAAPTTLGTNVYQTGCEGVKLVARVSAGLWNITLQDSYQRVLGVDATFVVPTAAAPAAPVLSVVTAGTNVLSNSAPVIQVLFQNTSSVATDPASGEQVLLTITLQDSSAP